MVLTSPEKKLGCGRNSGAGAIYKLKKDSIKISNKKPLIKSYAKSFLMIFNKKPLINILCWVLLMIINKKTVEKYLALSLLTVVFKKLLAEVVQNFLYFLICFCNVFFFQIITK
jgi:fatty acid desaturase